MPESTALLLCNAIVGFSVPIVMGTGRFYTVDIAKESFNPENSSLMKNGQLKTKDRIFQIKVG